MDNITTGEDFDTAVDIALEERFLLTLDKGAPAVYEIMRHIAAGGTINDCPNFDALSCVSLLGSAYVTMLAMLHNDLS